MMAKQRRVTGAVQTRLAWSLLLVIVSGSRVLCGQAVSQGVPDDEWLARRALFITLLSGHEIPGPDDLLDVQAFVQRTLAPLTDDEAEARKQQLIELLALENRVVETKERVRRLRGADELPPAERFTEAYVNHVADVIAAVAALEDLRSIDALSFNIGTGTIVTNALVGFGAAAVETIASRFDVPDPITRSAVIRTLTLMLRDSPDLSRDDATRSRVAAVVLRSAGDEHYLVRRSAVAGLMQLGDAQSVAIVRQMSETDVYREAETGQPERYPVRNTARKALDDLSR